VRDRITKRCSARFRTKDVFRFASVMAAIIVGAIALDGQPTVAARTPKAQSSPKAEEKAAAKPGPISVEDYFAGISKPGMSPGDQASFAKKHVGVSVTWTGYVRTVSKNLSPDGAFYQLILKAKPAEESGAPIQLFIAQLAPGADEKQVTALGKDQKVTVSGTLEVGKNPALPIVADAKLSGS
jgi:hypothetical protein